MPKLNIVILFIIMLWLPSCSREIESFNLWRITVDDTPYRGKANIAWTFEMDLDPIVGHYVHQCIGKKNIYLIHNSERDSEKKIYILERKSGTLKKEITLERGFDFSSNPILIEGATVFLFIESKKEIQLKIAEDEGEVFDTLLTLPKEVIWFEVSNGIIYLHNATSLKAMDLSTCKELWSQATDDFHVSMQDDYIMLSKFDGKEEKLKLLDRKNRNLIWQGSMKWYLDDFEVIGENIYIATLFKDDTNNLLKINMLTNKQQLLLTTKQPIGSNPIWIDDYVIFNIVNQGLGATAIDLKTGHMKWSTHKLIHNKVAQQNGKLYLVSCEAGVCVIDPNNGKLLNLYTIFKNHEKEYEHGVVTPQIMDNILYMGASFSLYDKVTKKSQLKEYYRFCAIKID